MYNRRDFIKITSLGLGSAALATTFFDSTTASIFASQIDSTIKFSQTPTYCEVCFWKCAGWVTKNEEGEIWKVEGHKDDPHCNGRLCPRGTGGVGMYHDEDRLKKPLMRVEKDGKQTYVEVSWDEALDFIANKMTEIKEKYGPESMALFTHGSGGKFLGHLMKSYGSPHITAPSFAQCRGPREVAFYSTFGEGVYSPERTDIRDTRCLVLIGSHIGENMHNGQVQEMSEAIEKGATIITVDPRFSTAASKSKHWLPIKPATDLALLLAWTHVIINEGWYDKEYVEKYCFGFDQLKAHVQQYTPEWAYGVTTLEPKQIIETAREMAKAAPAVIVHPGRHVTWYGDDTQRLRAVAILNALLGSWGRRGGFYFPDKISIPSYPHPEYPKATKSYLDAMKGKYNLASEVISNGLCEVTVPSPERDWNIKGWIVNGTNLIHTLPDQKKTMEAIQSLELMVAIDTMPMEITGYADVVLPECTYLERYDAIRNSPHRDPVICLRMPAVEPKYDSKPDWWIAKELGEKLGLKEYFQYKDIEEMLDWQLKKVGSSLKEMQKIGVKTFKRKFDDLYLIDGQDFEFNTSTGKIELYSTELAAEGFDPLPSFTEHKQPPAGFYRLNYGRAPVHTFSRTANNPNLSAIMKENDLWVNPKVAKQWGLKNGQYVWLKNQDDIVSTFSIKVRVTERIRWDSVYMVHGFGHSEKNLSRAFGKGASDTELISNVKVDPIMGGTGMRENFVTFLTEDPKPKEEV
ncbi:molybdopterin-containing oxidoreductase family protein [Reichenbachiella ulvae]|uniref:Molybdopterin-dependent oxidoreductase n=1 Tax=Reichenbachiella ulvae TaxID=2980104 RepID=A0ABT3D0E2_9BACT|nr:molybdopterin-dependent oxidoreductase [Reichenbachiella ulvae]MCV9389427.1 molybdopterin-dependent oxidoreductase [Reichenbachiella ulvae]